MKYLNQFGVILFIYFIGTVVNKLIIPTIPATVIGMFLLFIALKFRIIKLESIQEFSEFMLVNLAFFFIPPSVTLIKTWYILKLNLFKIIFIVVITTFITMIVTGLTVDFLIKRGEKNDRLIK